jgi:Skp family chaperone for outer membrane proteins
MDFFSNLGNDQAERLAERYTSYQNIMIEEVDKGKLDAEIASLRMDSLGKEFEREKEELSEKYYANLQKVFSAFKNNLSSKIIDIAKKEELDCVIDISSLIFSDLLYNNQSEKGQLGQDLNVRLKDALNIPISNESEGEEQLSFGYLNSENIINNNVEYTRNMKALDLMVNKFRDSIKIIQQQIENTSLLSKTEKTTMALTLLSIKIESQKEYLSDLNKRYEEEYQLYVKTNLQPILDKYQEIFKSIAEAKGLDFIIDTSKDLESALLYGSRESFLKYGTDVEKLVLKKYSK